MMECERCHYPDSHVYKTVHDASNKSILRRRECLQCGHRYSTEEHPKIPKPKKETA